MTVSWPGSHHHLYLSPLTAAIQLAASQDRNLQEQSCLKLTTKKLAPPFADKETGGRRGENSFLHSQSLQAWCGMHAILELEDRLMQEDIKHLRTAGLHSSLQKSLGYPILSQ